MTNSKYSNSNLEIQINKVLIMIFINIFKYYWVLKVPNLYTRQTQKCITKNLW